MYFEDVRPRYFPLPSYTDAGRFSAQDLRAAGRNAVNIILGMITILQLQRVLRRLFLTKL